MCYTVFMKRREKETEGNLLKENAFGIILTGFLIMVGVALFCAVYFIHMMHRVNAVEELEYAEYDRHYAFIADNAEREFWNEVYTAAVTEGEENHAYVEWLGDNLSADYTVKDLLRIAVNSSVDGIIFCGQDDEETVKLVNQAVEKEIPVVCLRRDMEDSERQCFVGVNSYDLGLEYGTQILEIVGQDEIQNPTICILVDDIATESMQNLITLAIRDSFSVEAEENLPEIEIIGIDTADAFSAEETIRDIFIKEGSLPDIMVCLNSIFTQCTYQAAVDYNRVGDVKILGYYSTNNILDAIEKQIIYATVEVDTAEMGKQSVGALTEYAETGYTSSYIPVRTWVIGKKEAENLLREARENATD